MNFVSVYCDKEDCIYNQGKQCSTTGIQISELGCETYEKEELYPSENPDKERV